MRAVTASAGCNQSTPRKLKECLATLFCFHKLFRKHYKEYLIFKINEALIDPADDMDVGELRAAILREEKPIPEGDEKNAQYKERLKEVSKGRW